MPKAATRSEPAASNLSPQTTNLTDRTAPRPQRANSVQSSDSDPTSSSGSSSEDDSESEREDEQHSDQEMNSTGESTTHTHAPDLSSSLPHIAGRPKPRIHRMKGDSGILSRLNAFLPKMKDANEDLQRQIEAGKAGDLVLDNADENGEQYIEMVSLLMVLDDDRDGSLLTNFRTLVLGFWKRSVVVILQVARRVMTKGLRLSLGLGRPLRRWTRISLGSLWEVRVKSRLRISRLSRRWLSRHLFIR